MSDAAGAAPSAPAGWQAVWSKRHSAWYYWCGATDQKVWSEAECEPAARKLGSVAAAPSRKRALERDGNLKSATSRIGGRQGSAAEHNDASRPATDAARQGVGAAGSGAGGAAGGVKDSGTAGGEGEGEAEERFNFGDARMGFPARKPRVQPYMHGWFYPPHRSVLKQVCTDKTECIIELGSWLGYSARFIAKCAPNAWMYCIDYWDNDFILEAHDDHYGLDDKTRKILQEVPLYDTFCVNLWEFRSRMVPMRMNTVEGLRKLKSEDVMPDVIYIDADHHYDGAMRDIEECIKLFPVYMALYTA